MLLMPNPDPVPSVCTSKIVFLCPVLVQPVPTALSDFSSWLTGLKSDHCCSPSASRSGMLCFLDAFLLTAVVRNVSYCITCWLEPVWHFCLLNCHSLEGFCVISLNSKDCCPQNTWTLTAWQPLEADFSVTRSLTSHPCFSSESLSASLRSVAVRLQPGCAQEARPVGDRQLCQPII